MKKIAAYFLSIIIMISSISSVSFAYASDSVYITKRQELSSAFEKGGDNYILDGSVYIQELPIKNSVKLNGAGNSLKTYYSGSGAMFYQNENVSSEFSNINIFGNTKSEVGIWLGAGTMSFLNSSINDFNITSVRYSAIGVGGNSRLILNNTEFNNNSEYDLFLTDSAKVDIDSESTINNIKAETNFISINIGKNWNKSFSITFNNPAARAVGTVGDGADISNIKVTNEGYYLENENGKLMLKTDEAAAIHFDMAKRETLYKGSTGFLYGAAEINVPSIDLLYGLQPDTMVQKAYGGLQHPTGDAVRTSSALLSAGVSDMQIYLQDQFLEWPYDAPIKNGEIDLDAYQLIVEKVLYGMICDEASQGDKGAFKGSDGKYYILNESKKNYSYVLFNEPDQIWYGGNLEGLKRAWLRIYEAVHKIDPEARCAGPNFSGFNEESYDSFLSFCYDNNCLPEIISWHELGDISLTDYYLHYDAVKKMQAKYYTSAYAEKSKRSYQPQLMVNEYARHYDIGAPGGLVKWLSMFEDKDMSGCMAYWAMANTLNEMAADQNSPSSTWWVYHWYAQMTGKQCPLISPSFEKTRFYGLSSYDEDINMAYVLFGGNENLNGKEEVYLDNTNSTGLINNNSVNIKIYGVSFSGQLGANYKPQVIFDGAIKVQDNTVKISISNSDEMQAYFAIVTKSAEDAQGADTPDLTYPVSSYEAEEAELIGGATAYNKNGWSTFATSGRADVGSINNNGDGVCFTVDAPEDGYYKASLFYSLQAPYVNPKTLTADANGQNRGIGKPLPYGVKLDGKKLNNIILESTITWSYKNHCDIEIYLSKGEHKITFEHINGNEGSKGNLQLVAAIDKLDIAKLDKNEKDFEICLDEMKSFKSEEGFRVTAVAPEEGYYTISSNGDIKLSKQCVDYAPDAKSKSQCSVYDTEVGNTVYLSKGANTLLVNGNATRLSFTYEEDKTEASSTVISAKQFTLHGNSPYLKSSSYAKSGAVVSELGIGQTPDKNDSWKYNYFTFSVQTQADGVYNLAIRYSNDEPAPIMLKADGTTYIHPYNIDLVERFAQIKVNDEEPETVYFKNTLSWDTFRTVDIQVKLNKGINTIKVYNDNSYQFSTLVNSTAPEIDDITVSRLSYDSTAASFIKGSESKKHSFNKTSSTTKASTSSNGKIISKFICSECGYSYSATEAISKISSVKLSSTSYTYDGKKKKPAVKVTDANGKAISSSNYTVKYSDNKNVGAAKATVTFKGNYTGTKSLSFKINPKNTTISKVTAGKKAFTVKWKKYTTQTTGYQIQYSTDKSFKKGNKTITVSKNKTTSKKITKLKAKKKYYIRIRTYKTVGKTKYYSSWSKSKAVKTK